MLKLSLNYKQPLNLLLMFPSHITIFYQIIIVIKSLLYYYNRPSNTTNILTYIYFIYSKNLLLIYKLVIYLKDSKHIYLFQPHLKAQIINS